MNKRLNILNDSQKYAFYGFPDFDEEQRSKFFIFDDEKEKDLILECPSLEAKIMCALQIGYFKAKHIFFNFSLHKAPKEDIDFIRGRYFPDQKLSNLSITKHEYYMQREKICILFGYSLWSKDFLSKLKERASINVRRDLTQNFIALEILNFLQKQKIVRPGYTTLQTIISESLTKERHRLKTFLKDNLTDNHKTKLLFLIQKDDSTLSELAALKQDAKNFNSSMMTLERKKHEVLKPLYETFKELMPKLDISMQNIDYYGSLIHHYTIHDLKRFDKEQTYLYLLCYIFKRYKQINDNIVDAFDFNVKKLENEVKEKTIFNLVDDKYKLDHQIAQLLLMYTDEENLSDSLSLGILRKKAFTILSKETIVEIADKMLKKTKSRQDVQWKERDKTISRYKHHLRPLFMRIDFESGFPDSPLLKAIQWMKSIFLTQKSLNTQKYEDFPKDFISSRIKPYLIEVNKEGKEIINSNRFEILVYRQIIKQIDTGALHIKDSTNHRPFAQDLVSLKDKEEILKKIIYPVA